MNWLLHIIGADDLAGRWYGFWSGFGSDLAELTLIGAAIRAFAVWRKRHAERTAQAERHHAEMRSLAIGQHNETRKLAEKHHIQVLDRLEAHHESLKGYVAAHARQPSSVPLNPDQAATVTAAAKRTRGPR